jgi:hypothetical protein
MDSITDSITDSIIAYCGLVCTDCPAYVATRADDQEALERVAAQWREEYDSPEITVESVVCGGCVTDDERKCGHWYECEIRACGVARGLGGPPPVNCAHCDDYACEKLEGFFGFVPDARDVLDGVRSSLP